jgi:transcriptional regulator with PAS, ATPase and Fis domain
MNFDPALRCLPMPTPERIGEPSGESATQYSLTQFMVGNSPIMIDVFDQIRSFANCDLTVLITGESGTGKELVARAIHDHSRRVAGPFAALNCAALPAALVASELFGYEKGAFTGAASAKRGHIEHAQHGTLFLDEIGDMPADLQVLLLRFLQEREILRIGGRKPIKTDVRIIAATNVSPQAAIAAGRLREDLYYRLNVLSIQLPPLRDRDGDVQILANYFLREAARELECPVPDLTPAALAALQAHQWPGNVRELIATIRRAVVLNKGPSIDAPDLRLPATRLPVGRPIPPRMPARHVRGSDAERGAILDALRESEFNMTQAARALGVSRATFYRMLDRSHIELSPNFLVREPESTSVRRSAKPGARRRR